MPSLSGWFENLLFNGGSVNRVVTVIGSGGKTSLIWHLAVSFNRISSQHQDLKILVTPTTKMFVPSLEEGLYNHLFISGELPPSPVPGVTLAGVLNKASGKLESFSQETLEKLVSGYDLVLIEGDGSRGLPLKAWGENEPVVPVFTDLTIGMLPLTSIGKPVSENLVHRLPLFTKLSGAVPGENIKTEHVLRIITGGAAGTGENTPPGLFAKAKGKKLLFFNQAENEGALEQAREIAEKLPAGFRSALGGIIAGSVKDDWIMEL